MQGNLGALSWKTLCLNCGKVLIANGKRLENANFDLALPIRDNGRFTAWARCNECNQVALRQKEKKL